MITSHRLAAGLAMCAGCATLKTETRIVEYPGGTRHVKRVVPGSQTYEAALQVRDVDLFLTLSTRTLCEEAEVPLVRRKRITTRTSTNSSILGEYWLGASGVALGGIVITNPQRVCSSAGTAGSETDPEDCTALGWTLVAAGAAVIGVAVIDSLRAIDREEDLGTHEGEHQPARRPCHAGPLAGRAVELRSGDGSFRARSMTSAAGEVSFSMLDAGEDALPSPYQPGEVRIGDTAVPLAITASQHRELTTHLYEDPRSRLARASAERVRQRCDDAVDEADRLQVRADSDDDAVDDALDAWRRAKARCDAQWSPAHQAKRDAAHRAITDNRVSAILVALTTDAFDRAEAVLAKHADAATRLRDDAGALQPLRKLVGELARALASRRGPLDEAQRRLCRARRIFTSVRGKDQWDRFKLDVAKNISELEGGVPSNLVRLMDAARCE
jgi:hypothetical protein